MVQGPGGYEFGDYWKLGLPMLLLFMAAAVLLVPCVLAVLAPDQTRAGSFFRDWRQAGM